MEPASALPRSARRRFRAFTVLPAALLIAHPAVAGAAPGTAAAAGLVDVATVLPEAVVDLRYTTADNFVGMPLYPADARCLVHESLVPGLRTAAESLRAHGDRLVFWDCYRPYSVQVRMFEVVPDPTWVARPTGTARSHTAGRSVDVTLVDATGRLRDMGTGFDDFTPRAATHATDGLSPAQQANRARLRAAMTAGGLAVYPEEWWHFDGPGAGVDRPVIAVGLGHDS